MEFQTEDDLRKLARLQTEVAALYAKRSNGSLSEQDEKRFLYLQAQITKAEGQRPEPPDRVVRVSLNAS